MERISITQAAIELNTTPAFIRKQMKVGALPIGKYFKGDKRDVFLIYKEFLEDYLAKK